MVSLGFGVPRIGAVPLGQQKGIAAKCSKWKCSKQRPSRPPTVDGRNRLRQTLGPSLLVVQKLLHRWIGAPWNRLVLIYIARVLAEK